MADLNELAQDYFERHPASDECHVTSDGRVFHNSGSARSHAAILKNADVQEFKRDAPIHVSEEVEEVEEVEETDVIDFAQELSSFDAETTSYADAKALFTKLGLTAPSLKKEDIFNALAEAKANTAN